MSLGTCKHFDENGERCHEDATHASMLCDKHELQRENEERYRRRGIDGVNDPNVGVMPVMSRDSSGDPIIHVVDVQDEVEYVDRRARHDLGSIRRNTEPRIAQDESEGSDEAQDQ